MPFQDDRGRVVRITFDVVYATGQMKTVAMNMSDSDWGNTALIAFSEQGVRAFVAPGLAAQVGEGASEAAITLFDTADEETQLKPAMLIVDDKGTCTPMCGAHGSISHAQANAPIGQFI